MKGLALLVGGLLLFTIVGCGGDPRRTAINEALERFGQAADNLESVRKAVAEAVDKSLKKGNKLTEKDFKKAEDIAKNLREAGKKLADEIKPEIERLKENMTPQEQQRLDDEYKEQLTRLFNRFQKEEKELNAELSRAEPHATKAALDQLRQTIRDSREEFFTIARPR